MNGKLNPGRLRTLAIKCSSAAEIKKVNIIKTIVMAIKKGVSSKKNAIAAAMRIPLNP